MKFQFSLATMLICTTVLALVVAVALAVPVHDTALVPVTSTYYLGSKPVHETSQRQGEISRSPSGAEVAARLAWSWPLSIAATLAVLWIIRRFQRGC